MPSKAPKVPKAKVPKSKAKKVSKKVEPVDPVVVEPVEPVVEPVAVESVAVEPVAVVPDAKSSLTEVIDDFDYSSEISELQTSLKDALNTIKGLVVHVNKLEKRLARDKRIIEKKLKSKPRRASNGLNGFSKPGPVSDELRAFLKLGKEDLIARTEVTKKITVYCQEHGLQKESDKRIILPDKSLTKLLQVPKGEDLTYFNLQKYMKVHFPNKEGVYPTL